MTTRYQGPLRHEPLAVELSNTIYAAGGELADGLATNEGLSAWLAAIGDRLPDRARGVDASRREEFLVLRGAVREALRAALGGERVPQSMFEAINRDAARAPVSPVAVRRSDGRVLAEPRYHAADPTDIALATLAADAIDVLTEPDGDNLRACGAPGCVLIFVRDHPRRTWCSGTCGNRARQARHYERVRHSSG